MDEAMRADLEQEALFLGSLLGNMALGAQRSFIARDRVREIFDILYPEEG